MAAGLPEILRAPAQEAGILMLDLADRELARLEREIASRTTPPPPPAPTLPLAPPATKTDDGPERTRGGGGGEAAEARLRPNAPTSSTARRTPSAGARKR